MPATLIVTGMPQIQRNIARSAPAVSQALTLGLRLSAEPVKTTAEQLSRSEIRRMNATKQRPAPWSVQRIGVTRKAVYVAPKQRGVKGRGPDPRRRGWNTGPPSFPALMFGRAYEPALERNAPRVRATVESVLTFALKEIA